MHSTLVCAAAAVALGGAGVKSNIPSTADGIGSMKCPLASLRNGSYTRVMAVAVGVGKAAGLVNEANRFLNLKREIQTP